MKTGGLSVVLQFLRYQGPGSDLAGLSDRQLLALFAERHDQDAFGALVRRHAGLVFRVCWRVLRNWQDAEDAFQAAFLVLARKAGSPGGQESVAGWLHEVACRVAAEARGTLARRKLREKQVDPMPEPAYFRQPDQDELATVVDEELRHLPETYRTPVILCCLQGLSRDQAAEQLGCTAGVVKGRLERGRRLLADRLSRRGIAVASALAALALPAAAEARPTAELLRQTLDLSATFATGGVPGASPQAVVLATRVLRGLSRGWVASACAAVCLLLAVSGAAVGVASKDVELTVPPVGTVGTQAETPKKPPAIQAPEPMTTVEHEDVVRAVTLSKDGKTAVSASFDKTIRIWRADTGKGIYTLKNNETNSAAALSPDDKLLAYGTARGTLCLLDMATFKEIKTIRAGQGNVYHLAFSPDGKTIATANHRGSVSLFDAATADHLGTYQHHEHRVWSVAWSPDGKHVASAGEDGSVCVMDAKTGKAVFSTKIHFDYTASVTYSPDGKRLATLGYDDRLFLLDAENGKKIKEEEVPGGACVRYFPDGKTLLTTDRTGNIHLWDAQTLERLHTGSKHDKAVHYATVSADGKRIITASEDGKAIVWTLNPPGRGK